MLRLFQKYLSPQVTTINCCLPPLPFKFSLSDTFFYIFFKLLRALFLSRMLVEFSLTCIFHHVWEKKIKFMLFTFPENALNLGIFTQRTFPTQNSMENFLKICVTQQQKGWRKLWVALSKFNRKIWRWLGALGYLFSLWFAIFLNVMTLPFYIYVYHIASVVLSLLLVLCNHDNLALKLHQTKELP